MAHTPCHLAMLVTLTLTLLVASADGFNVLRGTRRLSLKGASGTVKRSTATPRFVIVLDAGSSGTKVNVYEFHFNADRSGLPVNVTEISSGQIKVKPALHTLADNSTQDLKNYLSRIFDRMDKEGVSIHLPASQTELYLLATAGMRELRDSDKNKAKTLMKNVQTILLSESCNPFITKKTNIRIISGEEEAVYAWVGGNYLNGFFNTSMDRDQSVGVLEMGGSSLQVVYMPLRRTESGCDVMVKLTSEQTKELHVHSYSGFGSNGIRRQIMDGLCDEGDEGDEVENPCMLIGDGEDMTCDGNQVSVRGASDPTNCRERLRNITTHIHSESAASNSMVIYGIGSIRFAPETLRAVDDSTHILNVTALGETGNMYCSMTLENAAIFKNSSNYVSDDCLQGLSIHELLKKMDLADNIINLSQDINRKEIGWVLGISLDSSTDALSVRCNVAK